MVVAAVLRDTGSGPSARANTSERKELAEERERKAESVCVCGVCVCK